MNYTMVDTTMVDTTMVDTTMVLLSLKNIWGGL